MTEKRYVLFNRKDTDYILDNPNTSLDFIEMLGDALSSEEIVDRLNEQDKRIKEFETVIQQILYKTRANHTKGEYSVIVSVSPQMHDKLSNLIMKKMW